jgi:hypothetical protein
LFKGDLKEGFQLFGSTSFGYEKGILWYSLYAVFNVLETGRALRLDMGKDGYDPQ